MMGCPECGSERYDEIQLDDGIECECWDCGFYEFEFDEECDEEFGEWT